MRTLDTTRGCALAAALAACLALAVARPASAQSCGGQRSSCAACHEERGEHPVTRDGTSWHGDHAFGDLCTACHGGEPLATTRDDAHAGLVAPLVATRCVACHASPAPLLARYLDERGRQAPAAASRPPQPSAPTSAPPAGPGAANLVAGALVIAFALIGAIGVYRTERRRRGKRVEPLVAATIAGLRARAWSPALAGVALGVVITISLAFGHRLSGAAAYQQLAGGIGAAVAPDATYWRHVIGPLSMSWDLLAWLGTGLGALASALASGTFRFRTMPDHAWVEVYGPSVALRWMIAFLGAALTAFAAGIAGGCTASLAMSGGAVLIPGAFLFMAGMFGGGIPTAFLVHRGQRGRS